MGASKCVFFFFLMFCVLASQLLHQSAIPPCRTPPPAPATAPDSAAKVGAGVGVGEVLEVGMPGSRSGVCIRGPGVNMLHNA